MPTEPLTLRSVRELLLNKTTGKPHLSCALIITTWVKWPVYR